MTQQTKIQWTDFTVNFWEGCQKVGPGCDHCYAEARDVRLHAGSHWGPGAPRRKVKSGIWKLRKLNRDAEKFRAEYGHLPRIFCSSLSDVFDNAVEPAWRWEAQSEMEAATKCRIQLLTKRVGNVEKMVLDHWTDGDWPQHIGLMITVVNQEEANRDIPKLLALKVKFGIPWVGLSIEPMLGPIDLDRIRWWRPCCIPEYGGDGHEHVPIWNTLDWVICGGESGGGARPIHPDWARSLRDQCEAAGVPFHFKQWGSWVVEIDRDREDPDWRADYRRMNKPGWAILNLEGGRGFHGERVCLMRRVSKETAGRVLDGRTHDGVIA